MTGGGWRACVSHGWLQIRKKGRISGAIQGAVPALRAPPPPRVVRQASEPVVAHKAVREVGESGSQGDRRGS